MRKLLAVASAVLLLQTASIAQAGELSFNINVGGPPMVVSQPPEFIYPAELGFGVAVGVPYDMFYSSGTYYVYRGGGWYQTSSYGGNLVRISQRQLPREIRRYNIDRIHAYRDHEYRTFSRDRDHYRGKRFNPGREERHDQKELRHEEKDFRHDQKELRKEEKREEKRDKQERKEERKEERHER